MPFHHLLLASIYPILFIKEVFQKLLFPGTLDKIRVLLYHDIPIEKHQRFASQLINLKKSWNFISPDEFAQVMRGDKILKGKHLLLTFDDGFISNKIVAEKILDPLNIKAIFFVVADFISISHSDSARNYVSKHIYPSMKLDDVPLNWTNMNWEDLKGLVKNGHTIGAHTMTHAKLSSITNLAELETEISKSADLLNQKLEIPITHFAFPFGNLGSFSPQALKVAKNRFEFIYSGLRGYNGKFSSQYAIRRDSLTPHDSDFLIGSFLEGAADFQYNKSSDKLDSWANS